MKKVVAGTKRKFSHNIFSNLKNSFESDFRLRYWLLVSFIATSIGLYILSKFSEQSAFLKYIQDILPELLAGGVGAIVATYLNNFKDKSLKIIPHVVYPGIFGIIILFLILISGGVFTTVEIRICGNTNGQFGSEEIERINRDLKKINRRLKVNLVLDYSNIAPQTEDEAQSVNVTDTYSILSNKIKRNDLRCDIYELDVIWVLDFVKNGWIIPIDKYREKLEGRYAFGIDHEICKLKYPIDNPKDMKTFGIPNFSNVGFLMYRTDLFNELIGKNREPTSWDEMIEWLYEIKKKHGDEYDGFVFQGNEYEGLLCCYIELLWARGGDIFLVDGIPQVYSPEGVKTLSLLKQLLKDGIIPEEVLDFNEVKSLDYFGRGKTLVLRNWPPIFYKIQNDDRYIKLRNKVNVFAEPLAFDGVARSAAKMCLGGSVYVISKHALEDGKAKLAMDVIEYLTSEEYLTENVFPSQYEPGKREFTINVPANHTVLDNLRGNKDALDYSYSFLKVRNYRSRPKLCSYSEFSKILVKYVYQCLKNGDLTAEEALKNAQEELKAAF